jgi:cell division protein FtsL
MTDWADSIELRNNGIKCVIDARILSDLLRNIISLVMIAGALLFYSWTRGQIVETGYQTQNLLKIEESLLDMQEQLIAEEGTWSDPRRIDLIATRDLGMILLHPNQLILPPMESDIQNIPDSLALADSEKDNLDKSGEVKRFINYLIN